MQSFDIKFQNAQELWLKSGAPELTSGQIETQKVMLLKNKQEHGNPFYYDKIEPEYSDDSEDDIEDCEIFVQRDNLWNSHRSLSHYSPTKFLKLCYDVYERSSGNKLSGCLHSV
jgi:hypothetical protein